MATEKQVAVVSGGSRGLGQALVQDRLDAGDIVGDAADIETIHERYRAQFLLAYQIRSIEKRLLKLFKEGKVSGTIHTSIGQEFSAVFVAQCLLENDVVFSNHRCHGHYIARTGDARGLIAEVMGKASGACKGIGGSQHLCNAGFFSNGIQGGIVPVSAGIGLHHKIDGNGAIAVVYVGDGTLGEGVVYEALNIASLWGIPLLVVVEDNMYAQSTSSKQSFAGTLAGRAAAFAIPYYESSIWELETLESTVETAVRQVRERQQPAVLRVQLYRLEAHSKGDDDRDPSEIAHYRDRDPLTLFLAEKQDCDVTQRELAAIQAEIERQVAEIEQEPYADLQLPAHWREPSAVELVAVEPETVPQVKAINAVLDAFLKAFPGGVLIGEDIHSPYGGAFKVTRDLSMLYPEQVYTTPISEAAIVGVANGLALMGHRVVAEIMFGDFMTLGFDQLVNHAAKFKYMYGTEKSLPLVIRTPMGAGRGYGPTHSQSLEKHLAGIPGTQLFVLHGRTQVTRFYQNLLFDWDTPSVVIENKTLYTKASSQDWPNGYTLHESKDRFPVSVLTRPEPADITLIAFGGMSSLAEQAAVRLYEDQEISVELIFPLQIYPLNIAVPLESLRRTKRLVIVEEGTRGFDLGAELIASLSERWTADTPFKVRRMATQEGVLPSALPLESQMLPSLSELYRLCKEIYND